MQSMVKCFIILDMKVRILTICLLLFSSLVFADIEDNILKLKETNACIGCDLYGADLRDADLSNANLYRAKLSNANLSGVNLSGANLTEAYLVGADLRDADLSNANLSFTDLVAADLRDADLSNANLSGAKLKDIEDEQFKTRLSGALDEVKILLSDIYENIENEKYQINIADDYSVFHVIVDHVSHKRNYICDIKNKIINNIGNGDLEITNRIYDTTIYKWSVNAKSNFYETLEIENWPIMIGLWKRSYETSARDGGEVEIAVIYQENNLYKYIFLGNFVRIFKPYWYIDDETGEEKLANADGGVSMTFGWPSFKPTLQDGFSTKKELIQSLVGRNFVFETRGIGEEIISFYGETYEEFVYEKEQAVDSKQLLGIVECLKNNSEMQSEENDLDVYNDKKQLPKSRQCLGKDINYFLP